MTAFEFGQLLGSLVAPVWWLLVLLNLFMLPLLPFVAWAASRNLKRIRQQLERLNDALEARAGGPRTGPIGI